MRKIFSLFVLTLFALTSLAQNNGTFKAVRFVNVLDSTTVIPVNGTIYYNEQSDKFRVYQDNVWYDLLGSGGGGGTLTGANNGLSLSGTTVQMGGTLIQPTEINVNGQDWQLTNGATTYLQQNSNTLFVGGPNAQMQFTNNTGDVSLNWTGDINFQESTGNASFNRNIGVQYSTTNYVSEQSGFGAWFLYASQDLGSTESLIESSGYSAQLLVTSPDDGGFFSTSFTGVRAQSVIRAYSATHQSDLYVFPDFIDIVYNGSVGVPVVSVDMANSIVNLPLVRMGINATMTQDDTVAHVLARRYSDGEIVTRTVSAGGGITNGAAINELPKTIDGSGNLDPSGIFSTTDGNVELGSASISGGRTIEVVSSSAGATLSLLSQGNANVSIGNDAIASRFFFSINPSTDIATLSTSNSDFFFISSAGGQPIVVEAGSGIGVAGANATLQGGLSSLGEASYGNITLGSNTATLGIQAHVTSDNTFFQSAGGNSLDINGLHLTVRAGNAYTVSGNGNGGDLTLQSGALRGTGLDGDITIDPRSGSVTVLNDLQFVNGIREVPLTGDIKVVIVTGSTLTLDESHAGALVRCSNAGGTVVTIPTSNPSGWNTTLVQYTGGGAITFTGTPTLIGKTSTSGVGDSVAIVQLDSGSEVYLGR